MDFIVNSRDTEFLGSSEPKFNPGEPHYIDGCYCDYCCEVQVETMELHLNMNICEECFLAKVHTDMVSIVTGDLHVSNSSWLWMLFDKPSLFIENNKELACSVCGVINDHDIYKNKAYCFDCIEREVKNELKQYLNSDMVISEMIFSNHYYKSI